jgi:probable HAF family extracellular repeat protein
MIVAVAAALVLVPGPAVAAAPQVRLLDLGGGYDIRTNDPGDITGYSFASRSHLLWRHGTYAPVELGDNVMGVGDLNNRAHVVGYLADGSGFLWRDGALTPLRHPAGDPVRPAAVNDRDEVAGVRFVDDWAPSRPFVWRNGTLRDFPTWHGLSVGEAVDINNRGQVLVNLNAPDYSEQHALVWWRDRVTDLGSFGGTHTWAIAINDRGTVLGWSDDADGVLHPFLWQDGKMTDLAPGSGGWGNSYVQDLNEAGDVVGHLAGRPVLWRRGVPVDVLPGRTGGATALNNRGIVAGTVRSPADPDIISTPFRWRNGAVVDFPILTPGKVGTEVRAVDERGRIIGISLDQGGGSHIVVWTVG